MNFSNVYKDFSLEVTSLGYGRVERDDRLLDVLPKQTREKGVELWEKQDSKEVSIIQLRLPFSVKKIKIFTIQRKQLATALQNNLQLNLEDYQVTDN
jgi:hypothetical protein